MLLTADLEIHGQSDAYNMHCGEQSISHPPRVDGLNIGVTAICVMWMFRALLLLTTVNVTVSDSWQKDT